MENYGKIKIEFLETQFPDTYVRMQYVLYGIELNWDEEVIRKAKMTEESDYTMATLPQNTACIEIVDEKNDFDIGNNEGSWKAVQNNQEVVITAEIDGEKYPCGTFYISKFSFKGNVATFNLTDLIGTLDGKIFYDGMFYKSIKAGKLLEQIFAAAGCTKYKIAEDVYVTEVSGYLGVQSCRECIKAICFACGAIADDVRKDTIEIYYPDRYVQYTVGPERKVFGGTSVRLENYVSGVSIECSQYIISDQSMQLYNGTLGAGVTRITFTMPCDQESLEVIGGEVVKKSVNYVDVYMVEKGECTVNGIIYSERNFTYEKKVNMLPSGVNENIKKFGKCTLYNSEKLPEIAERLLDYYSLQKMLETQYFTECECVGKWMSIGNIAGEFAYTLLEKQTIDMTGGFLASATCRGYSRVVTELHFAGDDIYAGGNILI